MVSNRLFLLIATLLVVSCTRDMPQSSTLAPEHVTINSNEIAARFSGTIVRSVRNKPHSPPFMNGTPEHLRFGFDQDPLSKAVLYREPQLLVYPLNAYRDLFRSAPSEQRKFDSNIRRLGMLILKRPEDVGGSIPVLPPIDSMQLFCSQVRYLDFTDGAGIRFIARYSMEDNPTVTENIFYTFQGFTSDGRYYISAFYPVAVKGIPATAVALATRNFLNQLASTEFTPDLDKMDDIIKSLRLAESPPWIDQVVLSK